MSESTSNAKNITASSIVQDFISANQQSFGSIENALAEIEETIIRIGSEFREFIKTEDRPIPETVMQNLDEQHIRLLSVADRLFVINRRLKELF